MTTLFALLLIATLSTLGCDIKLATESPLLVAKVDPQDAQPKEPAKPQPKVTQEKPAWNHVNIGTARVIEGFLRIEPKGKQITFTDPSRRIFTKESYSGPVDITVVAKTAKDNIRLHAFNGAMVIFNWELGMKKLVVHRPDGTPGKFASGSVEFVPFEPLAPQTWYTLRWRIHQEGMEVAVDDKVVFSEKRPTNLSSQQPIGMCALNSVVDIKSLVVTPIADTTPAFTVRTRELNSFKAHSKTLCCLVFSPDSKLVLIGDDDGNATMWDAKKGEKRHTWEHRQRTITSVAFSHDGKLVAVGSTQLRGRPLSEVRVFQADGRPVVTINPLQGLIGISGDLSSLAQDWCPTFVAFSTDGAILCIGVQPWTGDVVDAFTQQIVLMSTESWKQVKPLPLKVRGRLIYPKSTPPVGVNIVTEGGTIVDVRNGRKPSFPDKTVTKRAGPVGVFAASPDHDLWALGKAETGEVSLWNMGRKEKLETLTHWGRVTRLAFSPNGRVLAVCCNDGLVKLWEVTIEEP